MTPIIDPFVIFVVVLTIVMAVGGLYIDKHGRMPTKRKDKDHPSRN